VEITEDIREWDYGDYEGITSAEIREMRSKAGLEPWDIWRDGCPGGEYVFIFLGGLILSSFPFC
jgi:probable phosphoglycerate mutase